MIFISNMSPIAIHPINTQILKIKKSKLSNYAQRFMLSQVKGISYVLENFFHDIGLQDLSVIEQKLKKIGILQIGRNIEEGIVISGSKQNYHVYSPNSSTVSFNILKQDSNEVISHFSLDNRSSEYVYSKNIENNIEDDMSEILDYIDKILYEAKNKYMPAKTPQGYIPKPSTSKIIEELNITMRCAPKNLAIKDFGIISFAEKELTRAIINKINTAEEIYKQVQEVYTRSRIRTLYKKYIAQAGKHRIGFHNAGPKGEDLNIYHIVHNSDTFLEITITNAEKNEQKFIINQKLGTVQRNMPYRFSLSGDKEKRIYAIPDYYTQNEIEQSNLFSYLKCANQELESFLDFSRERINKYTELNNIKANVNTANLEQYKGILDDIHKDFIDYKVKIRKLLQKNPKRDKFKKENNISTQYATTAVKFNNITPDGKDLRLSCPKVRKTIATQILVMKGDKIEKSFFIFKNKLLRFNITDLNDKIRSTSQMKYFYDEKYLHESNLEEYLYLLRDKLHEVNKKLDDVKKK